VFGNDPRTFAGSALVTGRPAAAASGSGEMRHVSKRGEQKARAPHVQHQTADPPNGLRPA